MRDELANSTDLSSSLTNLSNNNNNSNVNSPALTNNSKSTVNDNLFAVVELIDSLLSILNKNRQLTSTNAYDSTIINNSSYNIRTSFNNSTTTNNNNNKNETTDPSILSSTSTFPLTNHLMVQTKNFNNNNNQSSITASCSSISSTIYSSSSSSSSSSLSSLASSGSENRTLVNSFDLNDPTTTTGHQNKKAISTDDVKSMMQHVKKLQLNSSSDDPSSNHLRLLQPAHMTNALRLNDNDLTARSAQSNSFLSSNFSTTSSRNDEEGVLGAKPPFGNNNINNNNKSTFINIESNNVKTEEERLTFYWIALTKMDKRFLETSENLLKSNDPRKIKSYCQFMQTIVFNDFPAEIFLQRSRTLKILYELIVKSMQMTPSQMSSATTTSNEQDDNNGHHQNNHAAYGNEKDELLKCLFNCINYFCLNLKQ